ncbi:hypothetical protein [Alkalilacustris brevis]|uniref:hypothetical protein n=1 Tax=Alkalilacustris brevis TaxID=2026338 RepID=UPI000E0D7B21|nr:hypothetical protein [Alkalilacustris brevis]
MQGKFKQAALLALSLGIAAPANTVWAEQFLKIDGVAGESPRLPLARIPGDAFTPLQLRQFGQQGIHTTGDLVSADPQIVGRVLGTDPRRAQMMQRHLREAMSKR